MDGCQRTLTDERFSLFPFFFKHKKQNEKTKELLFVAAVRCCCSFCGVMYRLQCEQVTVTQEHCAPHCTAPHRKSCRWLAQRVGPTSSSSALVFLFFFFSFLFFSSLVDDEDDDDGHPLAVDSTRFSLPLLLLLFCFAERRSRSN